MTLSLKQLEEHDAFVQRHLGPNDGEISAMLHTVGAASLDALTEQTVPAAIRLTRPLDLPSARDEHEALAALRLLAQQNRVARTFIGLGYHDTRTPKVILRNVLENPGWYTAYTPYQPEVAQGRLEALLNFQQMVIDLTGLELANASLLDEATAAAEAMAMARRVSQSKNQTFFVDRGVLPQTLDVLKTRAAHFGFELVQGHPEEIGRYEVFGALFQYPDAQGEVLDLTGYISEAHARGAIVTVAADIMALVLLKSPGEMGADIAIGSSQRFGVPMGFGGPHAAYFATRDAYKRATPGRIIGVSVDTRGRTALRMALQTREQHIRREKANSNICTSQVLLANMAGFYAVYHGAEGVTRIARRIHRLAVLFAEGIRTTGGKVTNRSFFDTVCVNVANADVTLAACEQANYLVRRVDPHTVAVAFHECANRDDVVALVRLFTGSSVDVEALDRHASRAYPSTLERAHPVLQHPVFNQYHTETNMLRYLKRLQSRDLALDHSMIALGSCTMKLNATSEMIPVTWDEFANIHPFAPRSQVAGFLTLIDGLATQLKAITGFDAICMQPNSGAQGEYAGLLAIRRYLDHRGEHARTVCLIPRSAHGTNPATAHMMGMQVVVVDCDAAGNVDLADLKTKLEIHRNTVACLMVTYPSTHGVFEEGIREMCDWVHQAGGQVYMDGANLNAQLGLTRPADIGADVSHMNLHKTFCIPHGGGGPGMGPIGLKAHLAPFMPNHAVMPTDDTASRGQSAVAAAPFGSASILPISWMYITMMGAAGLKKATQVALLSANYIATRLAGQYSVLYSGRNGRVAHECIIDLRPLKATSGISEVDVAKRLMDYGFHAPTMSFPVAGTIMIEPTESESKAELDRFIDALLSIRAEIAQVEQGAWPADNNPLKHAPHTEADVVGEWARPYSRETAVFPLPWVRDNKFWPSVNRIDDVYGDRNLICSCPTLDAYSE